MVGGGGNRGLVLPLLVLRGWTVCFLLRRPAVCGCGLVNYLLWFGNHFKSKWESTASGEHFFVPTLAEGAEVG